MNLIPFLMAHSNEALTIAEIFGFGGTIYSVAKASPKAKIVYDEDVAGGASKGKIFKDVAPIYAPSAAVGGFTLACMILNCVLNAKSRATAAALLTSANGTIIKYQDKVTELLGGDTNERIKASIAQDEVDKHPVSKAKAAGLIENTGSGTDLFRDGWSGRYFLASRAFVDDAIARYNQAVVGGIWAPINDLYGYLRLTDAECGSNIGYNADNLLDISMVPTITDDGQGTCFVITYNSRPCMYDGKRA